MTTASTGRPIPHALTAKALDALDTPPAPELCPSSPAADRPRYCDPADCCRDAFGPAGWACRDCGAAFFGTPPEDARCAGCAASSDSTAAGRP